jgi:hypothetical protein
MMHKGRRWVCDDVPALELAKKLTDCCWCGCQAFRTEQGTVWASDSVEGAECQEFAVLRLINGELRQVESITTSWCTEEEMATYIKEADEGKMDKEAWGFALSASKLEGRPHSCRLCQ